MAGGRETESGKLSVALEEADVVSALRLHGRRSRKGWLFYIALSVAAVALGWGILATPGFPAFMSILAAIAIGSTAGWWATTIGFSFLIPWKVRRGIRRSGAALGTYDLSWDAEQVFFESPDTQSRKPWEQLPKWRQNKRVFLVYYNRRFFWIVPKRVFATEVERAQFETLLRDRIGPENRLRTETR